LFADIWLEFDTPWMVQALAGRLLIEAAISCGRRRMQQSSNSRASMAEASRHT
jgi:hypothetical protein